MTPDNTRRLLFALQENIQKFDEKAEMGNVPPFESIVMPPIGGVPGQA